MASNIGLPSVIVEFKQKASTAIQRGNTGIVALVLRDTQAQGLHNIKGSYDIPSELSEANKKYINLTLLGNVTAPSKVVAYVVGAETQLKDALDYLEAVDFNYLVVPAISPAVTQQNSSTFISPSFIVAVLVEFIIPS